VNLSPGFYVMRGKLALLWFASKARAETECNILNMREGRDVFTVVDAHKATRGGTLQVSA